MIFTSFHFDTLQIKINQSNKSNKSSQMNELKI
jgi:hypothetical protein